tara:strand:+ start:1506 stop:1886 length:381 start_codon:yes stop_codon:yes gene_type:complete
MATGGSIESVTLDGRTYSVAADADSNRQVGGDSNELQVNGDRTVRLIKTAMPWQADGLALSIDDTNGDQEFLQALADRNDLFPIEAVYASGAIFNGTGQIVGEISVSSQATTVPIAIGGSGSFVAQ